MEHVCRYTSLRASYGGGLPVLAGPKEGSFRVTHEGVSYAVSIEQGPGRCIVVRANEPVCWSCLIGPLYALERLLMIFDGVFVNLADVEFSGSPDGDNGSVERAHVLAQRLSYFKTAKHFSIDDKLVEWDDALTDEIIAEWQRLLDELDIAHQTYLYDISDSGMPVDLRLAFLVELTEPLVEVVNKERHLFPSLAPGERGTSLKQCLNALINTYGSIIFGREMRDGFDECLKKLVDSRVRIMHIKTNRSKDMFYDGKHSVYYMRKLSLLYRVILLDLLGIPSETYAGRLRKRTGAFDCWLDDGVVPSQAQPSTA